MQLLRLLAKPFHAITAKRRRAFYKKKAKQLNNTQPTIIANDCFGGLVYHNLGLQFRSPTINLYIEKKDFLIFASDLEGFLADEVKPYLDESKNYPMGVIKHGEHQVKLHFLHYHSFEEAKKKWDERKSRVDFNNVYLILTIEKNATKEEIETFEKLPYKNKMLISDKNEFNNPYVITHPIFSIENYKLGKILEYPSRFAVKRYMDEIDYVSFLNRPQ